MSEHQMLHMTAFFVYGSESYRLFGVKELSLTWRREPRWFHTSPACRWSDAVRRSPWRS